jgi:hypothetical protein
VSDNNAGAIIVWVQAVLSEDKRSITGQTFMLKE